MEFSPHDLRHLRVTQAVTKIRKDAKGDAALEAELLEGFQHLMGWHSRETMATYTKTLNKRKALEAILADEEEQEQCVAPGQKTVLQTHVQEHQQGKDLPQRAGTEETSSHDDDEFAWYEDEA